MLSTCLSQRQKKQGVLQCFATRSCDFVLCCCANTLQLSIEYSVEHLSNSFQKFCYRKQVYGSFPAPSAPSAPRDKVALPLPHFALTISAPGYWTLLSRHFCSEIDPEMAFQKETPKKSRRTSEWLKQILKYNIPLGKL